MLLAGLDINWEARRWKIKFYAPAYMRTMARCVEGSWTGVNKNFKFSYIHSYIEFNSDVFFRKWVIVIVIMTIKSPMHQLFSIECRSILN